MATINLEHDVHVIEVASLDDEYQKNFSKPYIVQFADGSIMEFDTDEDACLFQRQWRHDMKVFAAINQPEV